MTPRRIQRKRTKGWRKPDGAVYVGRGTRWGNPFRAGSHVYVTGPKAGQPIDAAKAVEMYREVAHCRSREAEAFRALARAELAGQDLMCWCPLSAPCHADVLLAIANESR